MMAGQYCGVYMCFAVPDHHRSLILKEVGFHPPHNYWALLGAVLVATIYIYIYMKGEGC